MTALNPPPTNTGAPLHVTLEKREPTVAFAERLSQLALGDTSDSSVVRFHQFVRSHLGAVGSFEVDVASDGDPVISDRWSPSGLANHAGFRQQIFDAAERARQQGTIQVGNPDGYELTTLTVPILTLQRIDRVWVIVIPRNEKARMRATRDFQLAAHHYGLLHERRLAAQAEQQLDAMSRVVDFVAALQHCDSLADACRTLVAAVAAQANISGAAITLSDRQQDQRLVAISGLAKFDPALPTASALREAAHESLLHEQPGAVWPPRKGLDDEHCLIAHRRAASVVESDYFASQPLVTADGQAVGVLLWYGSDADDTRHRNLLSAAGVAVTDSLMQLRRLQRSRLSVALRSVVQFVGLRRGKLVVAATTLLLAAMFVPVTYNVRCDCVTEPVTRRFAVAPFRGIVQKGFVKPGDRVAAGELLAEMDDRELQWELASITADQHRADKQRNVYLTGDQIPEAMMAELESQKLDSRKRMLEYRESSLEIRSPIDGFILSGDLERNENAPVDTGETLYEIGPTSPLKIRLFVPAEDLRYVAVGQRVAVSIDGFGGDELLANVQHIATRSQEFEGKNVFPIEVEIDNPSAELRPGMRGIAKVRCQPHPLGWNLFHKPWEAVVSRLTW